MPGSSGQGVSEKDPGYRMQDTGYRRQDPRFVANPETDNRAPSTRQRKMTLRPEDIWPICI